MNDPHRTPANGERYFDLSKFRQDFLASVVVFLVALPLCMGIAIASGVPVAAGLVTGIVGGLVVGMLAGSPLQVSGPAAGLTVIVLGAVTTLGLPAFGLAVMIAGGLQFAAGVFRLGQWFRAVSPAVIHGMLAGIGVLILASQFHVMVDDAPRKDGLSNLAAIPEAIAKGLPLPEATSREERRFRHDWMQDIAALQASQRELADDVRERLVGASAEGTSPLSEEDRVALAARQETLEARFETLVSSLRGRHLGSGEGAEARRLREAVAAASVAVPAAGDALVSGTAEELRETQDTAATALAGLSDSVKNHDWAAKVGLLTIAVILAWQSFAPTRLKIVPAPLVAIVVATGAAALLVLPVQYVGVPDNLFDDLHIISGASLQQTNWWLVIQTAVVIAAVASAETLLCATAVDQMHRGPRTKYDRELCAQGVGNMICGSLGALPMTGVIVRSSANVQAGAQTRMSAILHGAWLLVFVALLTSVVRMIPVASLAAMLVYTGYKLINIKHIKALWKHGHGEVLVYAVTLATIVAVDLLTGVLVGIALSAVKLLLTFARLSVHVAVQPDGSRATVRLKGAATFLKLPKLAAALEQVPPGADVEIDLSRLSFIDHACQELLHSWSTQHQSLGKKVHIDWSEIHRRFQPTEEPAQASVAA